MENLYIPFVYTITYVLRPVKSKRCREKQGDSFRVHPVIPQDMKVYDKATFPQ